MALDSHLGAVAVVDLPAQRSAGFVQLHAAEGHDMGPGGPFVADAVRLGHGQPGAESGFVIQQILVHIAGGLVGLFGHVAAHNHLVAPLQLGNHKFFDGRNI